VRLRRRRPRRARWTARWFPREYAAECDPAQPGPFRWWAPGAVTLAGMALTRLYKDGVLVRKDFPVQDISDHLEDPASVVWLDLCRPSSEDFAMIQEEFGLHELALEDARHPHQRPKLDHYRTHQFISAYATSIDPDTAELTTSEIAVFVTERAVITIRTDDGFAMEEVVARWDDSPDLAEHGVEMAVNHVVEQPVDQEADAVLGKVG
jgi:magnesium transporter